MKAASAVGSKDVLGSVRRWWNQQPRVLAIALLLLGCAPRHLLCSAPDPARGGRGRSDSRMAGVMQRGADPCRLAGNRRGGSFSAYRARDYRPIWLGRNSAERSTSRCARAIGAQEGVHLRDLELTDCRPRKPIGPCPTPPRISSSARASSARPIGRRSRRPGADRKRLGAATTDLRPGRGPFRAAAARTWPTPSMPWPTAPDDVTLCVSKLYRTRAAGPWPRLAAGTQACARRPGPARRTCSAARSAA